LALWLAPRKREKYGFGLAPLTRGKLVFWPQFGILRRMTKMLELAITQVRDLPEETQDLVADALFMMIEHVNDMITTLSPMNRSRECTTRWRKPIAGNSRGTESSRKSSAIRYESARHR